MWEIASRKQPYQDCATANDIKDRMLEQQLRPSLADIPATVPESYVTLMKECWAQSQRERPLFGEIVVRLSKREETDEDEEFVTVRASDATDA